MKPVRTIEKLMSGEKVTICAFGDSLTYGWMVTKGYLDYMKEMLHSEYPDAEVKFLNRGVPGDTAHDGLRRIREVTGKPADLVLVQFGLNDLYSGFSGEEFQSNLELIVKEINSSMKTEIALLTSVYLKMMAEYSHVLKFYERINKVAEKYSLSVANVHSHWEYMIKAGADFFSLVQRDGVHPTEDGYRLFAEGVMKILARQ